MSLTFNQRKAAKKALNNIKERIHTIDQGVPAHTQLQLLVQFDLQMAHYLEEDVEFYGIKKS